MSMRSLYFFLAVGVLTFSFSPESRAVAPATNAPPAAAPTPTPAIKVDPTSKLIADAIIQMNKNDLDGSLATINKAIQLDPKIPGAYVLRASIYYQKKQWPEAEADFNTAAQMSPKNMVIKFNLVEIKFIQKKYDEARAGYAALQSDPDMGDLASFKVFLCDVLAKHTDVAKKELTAFNKIGENPSYYYSNAVWELTQGNVEKARSWLGSAAYVYSRRKNAYYVSAMTDAGFLPLPAPPTK